MNVWLSPKALVKSGSESSISEACDNTKNPQHESSERDDLARKKDATKTIRKEILDIPIENMSKRGSLTSAKSLHELKPMLEELSENQETKKESGESNNVADDVSKSSKGIRPSKSETSIIDSFVVVESEYSRSKNNAHILRDGNYFDSYSIEMFNL